MWNEHGTYSNASSGADGTPGKDWVHKAGSAVAYYVTTTPTKRPDASTAFTTSDTGRMWVNSTSRAVKALSGTAFAPVSGHDQHRFLARKYLVTSIGGWNMGLGFQYCEMNRKLYYTNYPSLNLSQASIICVKVIVQSDGGNGWWVFPIITPATAYTPPFYFVGTKGQLWAVKYSTYINVHMERGWVDSTGGLPAFQSRFSNTAINRGWIVLEYV